MLARAMPPDRNPRNQRETLLPFVGKKVNLATTDFHHVVGRFVELRPDGKLRLKVGTDEVMIPRLGVASIQEAEPAVAEYVK